MGKATRLYNYRLTDEQMENLYALAVKTNSICRTGPTARQPSVSVMIANIADGRLIVTEREPWSLPAGLAEQAEKIEQQQREERERLIAEAERIQEQQRLEQALDDARRQQALPKDGLPAAAERQEQQRRVEARPEGSRQAKQAVRKVPPVKMEQIMLDLEPA